MKKQTFKGYDEQQAKELLGLAVSNAGGQKFFADNHKLDRSRISRVLTDKESVLDEQAAALGLIRTVIYVPTANGKAVK